MAGPRSFIGSTFYDLRQVRSDLERFVRESARHRPLAWKGRATAKVSAEVVMMTNKSTLDRFVRSRIRDGAEVNTDGATVYQDLVA